MSIVVSFSSSGSISPRPFILVISMPMSMLFGAAFLLLVDNLARCLTAVEIPIGILTAFVGAPFFIYLMVKGGERA